MNMYDSTAKVLRGGAIIGILLTAAGLVAAFLGYGETLLWTGLLILIISPMFGVVTTAISLILEKDFRWVAIALFLITISAISIVITAIV